MSRRRNRELREQAAERELRNSPGYRAGQMAALDGMDLPDGAYLAMADEMEIDPFDYDEFEP